jgi:hypothetical protein
MFKLKENYSGFSIDDCEGLWIKTKSDWTETSPGIHLNPNVVWEGTSEADYMTLGADMKELNDDAVGGTPTQKLDAKNGRIAYLKAAGGMAVQANAQCGGDEAKEKSTGLVLNAVGGTVGEMGKPVIDSATPTDGVVGREVIMMKKSEKFCFGTWINVTDVAAGTTQRLYSHSKHKLILTGLTPQKQYSVTVAYDGSDPLIVWSDPKTFWAQ